MMLLPSILNYSLSFPLSLLAQQTWSRGQTGTRPLPAPRQGTPHPRSLTSRFPAPATTLCLPATISWFPKKRTRDWPKSCHSKRPPPTTSPTGPNVGASTRATTSTWSVPHLGATHWVRAPKRQRLLLDQMSCSHAPTLSSLCAPLPRSPFVSPPLSPSLPPGHLTGRHERHFSISGCPLYHNLSADECKVLKHTYTQIYINKDYKDKNWNHEAEFYVVFSKDALTIFYLSVIFLFSFFLATAQ